MQNKSIEELENDYWGDPINPPTKLVEKIFLLRKKRLNDLRFDDIRMLISQDVGLDFIIPIAIDGLKEDPLIETDLYQGDLLSATMGIENSYWEKHPEELYAFKKLLEKAKRQLQDSSEIDDVDKGLIESIERFLIKGNG